MECGVEGGTVVTLEAGAARAGDGGDDSGGEVDFSDAVVAGVGDVEVVIVVDGESVGGVQGGYRCGAAVPNEARLARPGNGRDYVSIEIDLANAVCRAVGDEEIAAAVEDDSGRSGEGGQSRSAAVADSASGEGGYVTGLGVCGHGNEEERCRDGRRYETY